MTAARQLYLKVDQNGRGGHLHLDCDGDDLGYMDLDSFEVHSQTLNRDTFMATALACLRIIPHISAHAGHTWSLKSDSITPNILYLDASGTIDLQTGQIISSKKREEFLNITVSLLMGITEDEVHVKLDQWREWVSSHSSPGHLSQPMLNIPTLDKNDPAMRLSLSADPRISKGEAGERRTAEELKKAQRWRFLHSIPVANGIGDIDHLGIGPAGVVVVDSKNFSKVTDENLEEHLRFLDMQIQTVQRILSDYLYVNNVPVYGLLSYWSQNPLPVSANTDPQVCVGDQVATRVEALPDLLNDEEQEAVYGLLRVRGIWMVKTTQ